MQILILAHPSGRRRKDPDQVATVHRVLPQEVQQLRLAICPCRGGRHQQTRHQLRSSSGCKHRGARER